MDMNSLFEGPVREGFIEEITLSWLFFSIFPGREVGILCSRDWKQQAQKYESFTIHFFKEW